ncbi:hypothetical protein [Mycobacterium dioxanotrophicus]|jgi:hypothetical protein|uniref:hypothetical protein n=1 Tax=Mycobacterium dioxanotrophicus TaxID=482462 RepID=UPI0012FA878F|nr:hypothetical protein [Mycobacterium dioxanotrophicus]
MKLRDSENMDSRVDVRVRGEIAVRVAQIAGPVMCNVFHQRALGLGFQVFTSLR